MRLARWVFTGMAFVSLAATASAAPITITGEVIDPALYLREGRHGLDAEEQTYDAVDGGQSLAVLDSETLNVYLCLAAQPGDDPNELLYEYVGRRVRVTGELYDRGGLKGLVITDVEPLEQPLQTHAAEDALTAP